MTERCSENPFGNNTRPSAEMLRQAGIVKIVLFCLSVEDEEDNNLNEILADCMRKNYLPEASAIMETLYTDYYCPNVSLLFEVGPQHVPIIQDFPCLYESSKNKKIKHTPAISCMLSDD